jgi:hypothetical protein
MRKASTPKVEPAPLTKSDNGDDAILPKADGKTVETEAHKAGVEAVARALKQPA